MAYGVKYRAEWRATTRGVRDYVVEILKNGYTGSISPLYLTGDCITITYGEVDESELKPIKSSETEITALCMEDNNPYMELYTLDPAEYQVIIYENDSVIWRGYLATGDYTQPLAKAPYVVRFRANDGLAVLKAMPYLDADGNRYTDTLSVSTLLQRLLSPISDSVDIWNYTLIYAKQTAPTLDIVAIPDDSIYRAFGNEEPTYYDVLEEVLKTFAVQLSQQEGVWVVRSLSTLGIAANSGLLKAIDLDIIDTEGVGIKSDAVLSFLPPLRKMIADGNATSNSVDLSDILCDYRNWYTGEHTVAFTYKPGFSNYGKALAIKSGRNAGTPSVIYDAGWNIIPNIISRSSSVRLTISAELYNDDADGVSAMYMGVWLVKAGTYPASLMTWRNIDTNIGASRISFAGDPIYWDAKKSQWVALGPEKGNPTYSTLGMQQVNIEKGSVSAGRPSLSVMSKASISFEMPEIPNHLGSSGYIKEWQIAVVTTIFAGNVVYLANPKITVEVVDGASDEQSPNVEISKDGISDESYAPLWRTATEVATATETFLPSIIDLSNEDRRVYGYVDSTFGIAGKDVVGKMLADLRYRTTYTIDGEVDKPIAHGVNNVATYGGRWYYTNYVKHLCKRGVASIQLREIPYLSEMSGTITIGTVSLSNTELPKTLVGLTKSLYYTTSKNRLGRVAVPNGGAKYLATYTPTDYFTPTLSKGVACVVLAEGESRYNTKVRAYDDNGELVAQVDDFSDDYISGENWIKTARYDAIAKVWLASDGGNNVVMCDSDGYVLVRWQCGFQSGTTFSDVEIMPYNGGFLYRAHYQIASGESGYRCLWHCYAIHRGGSFDENDWSFDTLNIRYINERYMIYVGNDGKWKINEINKRDLSYSATASITTLNEAYNVVAINNALVLITRPDGVAVYDPRNGNSKYYNISTSTEKEKLALCGDFVYTPNALASYRYDWRRIIPKISNLSSINIAEYEQL